MEKGNETKTVVPALRFPEFRKLKEWEVSSIGESCQILNNKRKPISEAQRTKGPYPYYGASGIIDHINNYIFDEELLLIGEDGAKWGAYENSAFVATGKYWVNNHAHVLKPIQINIIVLKNYLIQLDLAKYITGAAPPKLTLGKLKEIEIPISKVPLEQQKIADCLSSLDDLIEATNRKIEALKEHKKGLMQQLFPKKGENVPELRFPEFQGTKGWEEKKLTSLCDITNGKCNAQDHIEGGKYPLFDRSAVVKYSNNYLYDCEAVIIPGEGVRFIPKYYNGKFNLHQRAYALKDFSCNGKFLFYDMEYHSSLLAVKAVKSTVLSLRLPILQNFPLHIPFEDVEQQKIADCLSSLDELIEVTSQKVEILKEHKKGLMQQLFPKI